MIRAANRYFDYNKPWELAKQGNHAKLANVLHRSLEAVRIAATLTWPIMPQKSEIVFKMLGFASGYQPSIDLAGRQDVLQAGTKLNPLDNIFPRLQAPKEEKVETAKPADTELPEGIVTIDDFFKTKLVVAEVIACENVPETSKLLKLQIVIGEDKRQIVAGVAEYYKPEEMVGKKIVVVANLKPTKIRGIDSNGMLLAAKKGKELKLVTVDGDIPSGATVG